MDLIEKLNEVSTNRNDLTPFLQQNINLVYDFFLSQGYNELKEEIDRIDNYIFSNYRVLKTIDLNVPENFSFISILLDVCERFGFISYYKRIYKLLDSTNSSISTRHKAAVLFSIGIKEFSDYEKVLDDVLNKLQFAGQFEEDNYDKVISTFINFYAQVVYNYGQFNCDRVLKFRDKIGTIKNDYYFLKNPLIDELLLIDIRDFNTAFNDINDKLDLFLKRTKVELDFSEENYLIESETEYAHLLDNVNSNFDAIREISVNEYNKINDDSIFYSLGRGVEVLKNESQLFTYMHSYGKMHFAKCKFAFSLLEDNFFENNIEIIDWGCGQAIASMSYLDFVIRKGFNQIIEKINLNEPSEIALKRGALHIAKYNDSIGITTINKDINSINQRDFNELDSSNIKLHLFSNILDIDSYSTKYLADLIKNSFKGENYFIIISPYITALKTIRIDKFISEFTSCSDFELIQAKDKLKGEWLNHWTLVLRIFKVNL